MRVVVKFTGPVRMDEVFNSIEGVGYSIEVSCTESGDLLIAHSNRADNYPRAPIAGFASGVWSSWEVV
jgi:hypothetical protein